MANKIKINDNTYQCPNCGYKWTVINGLSGLKFNEDEYCLCCPICLEFIEDGDDYD